MWELLAGNRTAVLPRRAWGRRIRSYPDLCATEWIQYHQLKARGTNLYVYDKTQGYFPLTPNAKIAIKKGRKTTQRFVQTPSELNVIACVTCTLRKIAWRGSRVIYSNYHTRSMTPSYTSLLGTNFRPQPFYELISGMLKFQLFASF